MGKAISESFLEGKDMRIQVNRKSLVTSYVRHCLCVALVSAACAHGQNVNGTIVGSVTDSTGASVPGASVTITDVNTGVNHSAQTDAGGYYSAPDLPPGSYKVSIQKEPGASQ
jgi:Carboxypeptidase regulatory-like domain